MKTNRFFLIAIAFVGMLSSCSKEEKTPVPEARPISSRDLTNSFWKVNTYQLIKPIDLNGDGKPDSDLKKYLKECALDDLIEFSADGFVYNHNGTNLCDSKEPENSKIGEWKLDDSDSKIYFSQMSVENPIANTWKILGKRGDQLQVEFPVDFGPNSPIAQISFSTVTPIAK